VESAGAVEEEGQVSVGSAFEGDGDFAGEEVFEGVVLGGGPL
jgi:hypothetical protein